MTRTLRLAALISLALLSGAPAHATWLGLSRGVVAGLADDGASMLRAAPVAACEAPLWI